MAGTEIKLSENCKLNSDQPKNPSERAVAIIADQLATNTELLNKILGLTPRRKDVIS